MIASMTGFAALSREFPIGSLSVELRTVNHRYLELHFRLDEIFRNLEPALRETLQAKLARGKVDCRISLLAGNETASGLEINTALVGELALVNAAVRQIFPTSRELSVAEILRWPGVLATEKYSPDALRDACLELFNRALDELNESRRREGEKLAQILLDKVAQIEQRVSEIAPKIPHLLQTYQEKLAAKLRDALAGSEEERIRQEIALYAQKIDVDEELSRLTTHLVEVRRVLQAGGGAGKRLDFLMQELHREANTLGSKSVAAETSHAALELKVIIEQMREQIQNIE